MADPSALERLIDLEDHRRHRSDEAPLGYDMGDVVRLARTESATIADLERRVARTERAAMRICDIFIGVDPVDREAEAREIRATLTSPPREGEAPRRDVEIVPDPIGEGTGAVCEIGEPPRCGNCGHADRCKMLRSASFDEDAPTCDWDPSRYTRACPPARKPAPQPGREVAKEAELLRRLCDAREPISHEDCCKIGGIVQRLQAEAARLSAPAPDVAPLVAELRYCANRLYRHVCELPSWSNDAKMVEAARRAADALERLARERDEAVRRCSGVQLEAYHRKCVELADAGKERDALRAQLTEALKDAEHEREGHRDMVRRANVTEAKLEAAEKVHKDMLAEYNTVLAELEKDYDADKDGGGLMPEGARAVNVIRRLREQAVSAERSVDMKRDVIRAHEEQARALLARAEAAESRLAALPQPSAKGPTEAAP